MKYKDNLKTQFDNKCQQIICLFAFYELKIQIIKERGKSYE